MVRSSWGNEVVGAVGAVERVDCLGCRYGEIGEDIVVVIPKDVY